MIYQLSQLLQWLTGALTWISMHVLVTLPSFLGYVHRFIPEIQDASTISSHHGASIGGVWVSSDQRFIRCIYVTCIYCGLSMKINPRKSHKVHKTNAYHAYVRKSWAHLLAFVFTCVVDKDPNTSNWSSMDDDTIRGNGQKPAIIARGTPQLI